MTARATVFLVAVLALLAGCTGFGPAPDATGTLTPENTASNATDGGGVATPTDADTPTAIPNGSTALVDWNGSSWATLTEPVTVVEVVDGDTIDVEYANGTVETVRLLGVDTPEVSGDVSPEEFEGVPDTDAGAACLRRVAEDASAFAESRLAGEQVRLAFDARADRRGGFGRLLAYVVHDGVDFNYRLLADGHARVYDSTFSRSDAYYAAERESQSVRRGVWSCRDPTATGAGDGGVTADSATGTAAANATLVVDRIHADAQGNDNENLNDEYVVFRNAGTETLTLGSWAISDAADHRYTFPDGFALAPGETVTLHTGSGTDTGTDLYWGRSGAVWNNGGDTVTVTGADGRVVVERSYG